MSHLLISARLFRYCTEMDALRCNKILCLLQCFLAQMYNTDACRSEELVGISVSLPLGFDQIL